MDQNILSLDLGTKYVGVALRSSFGKIHPLESFSMRDVFELKARLKQLINDYSIDVLVVGDMGTDELPKQLHKAIKQVANEKNVDLEVVSEHLSSFQAEKEILDHGNSLKGKTSHSQAAVAILQDYIESAT